MQTNRFAWPDADAEAANAIGVLNDSSIGRARLNPKPLRKRLRFIRGFIELGDAYLSR